MRGALLGLVLAACQRSAPPAPKPADHEAPVAAPVDAAARSCERAAFAESSPVPEASGAAWLTIDGKLALVVIGDSGNDGAYAIVDPETGDTREQGKLPLAGKDDDLEGAAAQGGRLVAITSPGWIRVWERSANGFTLVDGPYALGPIDEDRGNGNSPPPGDGMVCAQARTNCGRNYEGLCLAPSPSGACVGFAASKADGHLYCLTEKDHRLAVDRTKAIVITKPGALADCAFSDDGTLLAGSNLFDTSHVYRVEGWHDPASARVVSLGTLGIGFPETIAARGDVIYRMSDTGGAPSLMVKYRCPR